MQRTAFVVVLTLALSVMARLPVSAADDLNCAYRLVPVSRTGSVTTAELDLLGCYATYEQAIEAGTAGAVDVPNGTTPTTLLETDLAPEVTTADVLIGTEFAGSGYGTPSTSYFASATCSASNTWQVNYVGDAVNDLFSSGKGFGGCDRNKKFHDADFAGAVLTCTPNCSDYGSLSNQVSSLRWKP